MQEETSESMETTLEESTSEEEGTFEAFAC